MKDLSPTAYVILGMIRDEPRSGYEIKGIVDNSTRFFWAASYGQIYPELHRLEETGLVAGRAEPRGGRRRTVYELTDAGREELRRWLDEDVEVFEVRDEGLLKLFFAAVDPERADEILAAKQRLHEEKVAALRVVEPKTIASAEAGDPFPHLVLRYGLESSEWVIDWCERTRTELAEAGRAERNGSA
jgi:DNA-binding PadR family transcriptional regulator